VHGPPIYPSLCSRTADVQETMYTSPAQLWPRS
jgi:hypothetical protein